MTSFKILMIFVPICMVLGDETLTLDPHRNKTRVLKGAMLTLKCVSSGTNTSSPNFFYSTYSNPSSPTLIKDGFRKFSIQTKAQSVNAAVSTRTIITLTKNETDYEDAGSYTCSWGSQMDKTNVYIFDVIGDGSDLQVASKNVTLGCTLNATADVGSYIIQWKYKYLDASKGTKDLINEDKYSIGNGSLIIHDPVRSDMGEYLCVYKFDSDSKTENETVTPKPVVLRAGPNVDTMDSNKNMVQGEEIDIKCEVSGFPFPSVEWLKDGIRLNASQRVHFSQDGKYSVKIYSLDFSDDGTYTCYAENLVEPFNATKSMRLRVKDKLAALWPFLGIVAEVIILCAIILIYEKRRSKKLADEDDAPDSNPDNTVDHKDVRHRKS